MEIVRYAIISQYGVHGSSGDRGLAANELQQLGVVEEQIFFGERGRGGKVLKLRITCENQNVK